MAGRQQFSQPINVISSSAKSVALMSGTSDAVIAPAAYEQIMLYAPANTIAELVTLNCTFPNVAAAAAGTKSITLGIKAATTVNTNYLSGNYNAALKINTMAAEGHTSQTPNDISAFTSAIKGVKFDSTVGLTVVFRNDTGAATQLGETRTWNVMVAREVVV